MITLDLFHPEEDTRNRVIAKLGNARFYLHQQALYEPDPRRRQALTDAVTILGLASLAFTRDFSLALFFAPPR